MCYCPLLSNFIRHQHGLLYNCHSVSAKIANPYEHLLLMYLRRLNTQRN